MLRSSPLCFDASIEYKRLSCENQYELCKAFQCGMAARPASRREEPSVRVLNGGISDLSLKTVTAQNTLREGAILSACSVAGVACRDIKMDTYRQIILAARPKGLPTLANFRLESGPLPAPAEGQLLLRTKYLSLEPYVRGRMNDAKSYAAPIELEAVMEGEVIAEILVSRHQSFREGELVQGRIGWRTHAAVPT
jgi:hypothetical protein